MKTWKPLEPGEIVDVVAPAGACKPRELKAGIRYLKSIGLTPRVPTNILKPQMLNLANTDEVRFQHLKAALLAQDSRAIWCLRGGYGSIRLVEAMRALKKPPQSKVLLGFSDITTIHNFLNFEWKWPTLHSPVLVRMGGPNARASEKRELESILYGKRREIIFNKLRAHNAAARSSRVIRAPIVGGNLTVLQSSLGTRGAFKGDGKILFFEDINEQPYRIDRMLEQMRQAGIFKNAKAIVLGTFTMQDAKDVKLLWGHVIPAFASQMKIPVLSGLRVGHGPQQHTLPFLTDAELGRGILRVKAGFA